jgi:hypothetical protein
LAGHAWQEEPDGFRYLYVDYRGAAPQEALDVLLAATEVIRGTHDARVLIEIDGSTVDRQWMAAAKRSSHEVFGPNGAIAAIVGVHPFGRVLMRGMNAVGGGGKVLPFPHRERALEWLRRV